MASRKEYASAYVAYTFSVVDVPSYRIVTLKQPYKVITCAAFSPRTNEIAAIGGTEYLSMPPGGLDVVSIIAPRYGPSRRGGHKYLAYYPRMANYNLGSFDYPTTIRWSSSGKYLAFVDAYKSGQGPVCVINVAANKFTYSETMFKIEPSDVWVLDDGWVFSSCGGAGFASGRLPMVELPPLGDHGGDQVVGVYETAPNRFLLAVYRDAVRNHSPLEIWEGQVSPRPKLNRRLLKVSADSPNSQPGASPITFTQHGKVVWIPIENKIRPYRL